LLLVACVGCSDPSVTPDAAPALDAYVARVSLTPSGFDFGEYELGTDPLPPPLSVSVKNISPLDVDLTAIAVAGADAADFTITSNGCGTSLAPEAACPLTLQFAPHAGNLRSAQLDVTTGADVVSAPLTGTGMVRGLKLVFDPPSRDFGHPAAGTTSGSATIHVLNEAVAATFTTSLTGEDAASFQIVSTTCDAALALHASCEVVVSMTPAWTGDFAAALTVSAGAGAWSAGLVGGSSTPIETTPTTATMGSMLVGQPEAPSQITFTVKNTSAVTSGTLTPTLSGAAAGSYSIDSTDCTALEPDATCSVLVSLAATTRGNKLADLVVTDGASNVQSRSALIGNAYTVFITTSPQFAATAVGQSTTKTLTVTNASDRDTGAVNLSIAGAEFSIVDTSTCSSGIAAHGSCTVQVAFDPASAGTKTATLEAAASPGSSHSVTLTGTGQ
jgi:hypothetical protein